MLFYSGRGYPYIEPPEDGDALADFLDAVYSDELCVSESFDPAFVDGLCASGFIPMAARDERGAELLIPKMHVLRSILEPAESRATRTARRESSRYSFALDARFDEVLEACVRTHGDDWLRPPLLESWRALRETRDARRSRFVSMELCEGGRLVAGEIGVFVGGCYTSLTGFRTDSGSGTVQLAAAGRYLEAIGARLWDLGMPLEYKAALGARNASRAEFLRLFRAAREAAPPLEPGPFPARALIDRALATSS